MESSSMTKRIKLEEDESPVNFRENAAFDEKLIKYEPVDREQEETKEKHNDFEKEIKLEPMIENVKEEVLDDEYFESHVPKLEPVDEFIITEAASSSNCFEDFFTEPEVLNIRKTFKSYYRRCQLCKKSENEKKMKNAIAESSRLILVSIFFKDYFSTVAQATKFLNAATCRVCASHYTDAVSKLQDCLFQSQKMNDLMNIVDVFCPNTNIEQFRIFVVKFVQNNRSNRETMNNICSICKETIREMTIVRLRSVKLMVMMGCILSGTHTIGYAKLFIPNDNESHSICYSHLEESLNEICKALRIGSHLNIILCRVIEMQKLMKIVNILYPEMQSIQFLNLFTAFGSGVEKFKKTNAVK